MTKDTIKSIVKSIVKAIKKTPTVIKYSIITLVGFTMALSLSLCFYTYSLACYLFGLPLDILHTTYLLMVEGKKDFNL